MKFWTIPVIAIALVPLFVLGATGAARQAAATQQATGTVVLEKAPTNRSIAIPKEKLAQHFKDMDARQLSTLRLIEGGKYNVNIRRITNAETALVHPATIDVWVVLDGEGTMTTGGKIVGGKIIGGVTNTLEPGDVQFVPAGVPHGVSGVHGSITWLNVRWDTDWPLDAPMGAGNAPPAAATVAAPRAGRGPNTGPVEYAPTNRSIHISKDELDGYRKQMDSSNSTVLRLIEGGHFNVNIRRIKEPSTEFHETTIDTWVILEGSGTANTGFRTDKGDERAGLGKRVDGTGVSVPASIGDLFFVPAHFTHGFTAVNRVVAWLNIRWDANYGGS